MALTDNNNNASQTQAKAATTLLDFVSVASSNIQEALAPRKKRNVNVRKFIQKRVKRLNDKGGKSGNTQTKTKSVLKATKPSAASLLQSVGSRSWPQLSTTCGLPQPVQTRALPTASYPTSPEYSFASETSLYPPANEIESKAKLIDPELESLLSEFGLESQSSTRHSSDSFQASVSPCYTPQPSLENQAYLGEHPYSPPNSDCSADEIFDDSAYSSPIGSVGYQSNVCSPPVPVCSSLDWPVQSPEAVVAPQCPVTTSVCGWFQQTVPSSGSGWMTQYSTFDQGPPMTPTVSELLLDRANYF